MGFPKKSLSLLLPVTLVSITIISGYFSHVATAADYTNLVFKGCADQKFQDPSGVYSQNLKTLLQTLVSQSSQRTFSTAASGEDANAINGLYQCRGDLTTSQCYSCVSKTPELSDKLCGKAVAARVQLSGCYLRYEVAGFKQVPETEFLYKVCGSSSQASVRTEFESKRDTAFNMAEDGVKSGSTLFYTGDYQSVYVLGQCEGDLGTGSCGDCVKTAFETAKEDCGDSVSAQVYLDKCYISYSYYPNGIPTISSVQKHRPQNESHFFCCSVFPEEADCCREWRYEGTYTKDSSNRSWRSCWSGVPSCLFDVSQISVEETK